MFRYFFRIGFGGCGCALEDYFRKHAVELSNNLLNKIYLKKLQRWGEVLSDEKFQMTERIQELKSRLVIENENPSAEKGAKEFSDTYFIETLPNIITELSNWNTSLQIAKDISTSEDKAFIDALSGIITEMMVEAGNIKNRGAVLLESLPVDSAATSERHYLYNKKITETRELIVDHFGHAVIESSGFNHHPELQMLPLSIKEVRDEVYKKIVEYIGSKGLLHKAVWGDFFFVGLGGGTGTGVISPLAERFGKGSYGYFTLALLGGEQDKDKLQSQQPWFRRCFNMLLALNDLIKTAELDGIILVDNNVIIDAIGKDLKGVVLREEIDKKLIKELYPAFGLTALENKDMGLDWSQLKGPILSELTKKPPVILPYYASSYELDLPGLVSKALESGNLAPCNNHNSAEKVFVYARWIENEKALRERLEEVFSPEDESLPKKEVAIIKEYLFCWDDLIDAKNRELELEKLKIFLKDICNIGWAKNAELVEAPKNEEGDESDKNKPKKLISRIFRQDSRGEEKNKSRDELVLRRNGYPDQWIKIQMEKYLFDWDDVFTDTKFGDLKEYLKKEFKIDVPDNHKPKIDEDKKTISIEKDGNEAIIELDGNKKATCRYNQEKRDLIIKKVENMQKIYQPMKLEFSDTVDDKTHRKPELDVKNENGKCHVYLKGCSDSREWILESVKKDIVVFESQEIGPFWHEEKINEVLILLVNPDVKGVLYERLNVARNFVWLLDEFKTLIDVASKSEDTKDELDIAKELVKEGTPLKEGVISQKYQRYLAEINPEADELAHLNQRKLPDILKNKIEEGGFLLYDDLDVSPRSFKEWVIINKNNAAVRNAKEKKDEEFIIRHEDGKLKLYYPLLYNLNRVGDITTNVEDEPLVHARDFLFPKELYGKNKAIYGTMAEIVDRLKKEVDKIGKKGWWPIFEEKIFDSISLSGKHDEVLLSVISALDKNTTRSKFYNLVGEDVYKNYSKTYQRHFFKYNSRYLYSSSSGGNAKDILSDGAEEKLPEELKVKIRESTDVIVEKTLEEWVEDYRDKPARRFKTDKVKRDGREVKRDLKEWEEEFKENEITLDNPEAIKNEAGLIIGIKDGKKTYDIKEEKEGGNIINVIYGPSDLSFPAMLAITGLYADWQGLCRVNIGSKDGSDGGGEDGKKNDIVDFESNNKTVDENVIKEALFKEGDGEKTGDIKICTLDDVKNKDPNNLNNLLIIDKDNEDAAFIIRGAVKELFSWEPQNIDTAVNELNSKSKTIPDELSKNFKEFNRKLNIDQKDKVNENKNMWKLQTQKDKINNIADYICYYIEKSNNNFKIYSDESHELRVKVAKENEKKTLKIYKKRWEKF